MINGFLDLRRLFVIGLLKYSSYKEYGLVLKTDLPVRVKQHCGQVEQGGMPERTGRYSVGVGFRHSVTMRNASLIGLSSRRACAL